MDGCWIILVVMLVVAVIWTVVQTQARQKAREAYQNALASLRYDPTDSYKREETLRLGREYSNLTRNRSGVTIFDEVALSNDISAACAGAVKQQKTPPSPPLKASVEFRLVHLGELKSKGLIDETEYSTRRAEILKDV